jgi:hypothetical protein
VDLRYSAEQDVLRQSALRFVADNHEFAARHGRAGYDKGLESFPVLSHRNLMV